jgi:bacillithiol system protein YtxJ
MSKLREPVGLITVQKARAVSDEIEKRWNVDHESPQVLIIRDDKVMWDASHFHVKAQQVESALESA